jgi:MSHA biogenesis protein MshP
MSPNVNHTLSNSQRGFLLPVAVFILVVMSVAAIALWRSSIQSSNSTVQELISTQALYAAESGAQAGVGQIFTGADRDAVNAQCDALNLTLNYSVLGLRQCSARVSCSFILSPPSPNDTGSVYVIDSVGTCGTSITAERTVRVDAYLGEEE